MSERDLVYVERCESSANVDALAYIRSQPPEEFDEYANPFESKLQLKKAHHGHPAIRHILRVMHSESTRRWLSGRYGLPPLEVEPAGYHTAVFWNRPGDRLQMHLDSVVHGLWRKVVTANLYLTPCEGGLLRVGVGEDRHTIPAVPGTLAIFCNDDEAYHEVTRVVSGDRISITTGYVVPVGVPLPDDFTRTNERAWFVPTPGEQWTPEMYRLREERAGVASKVMA